MRARVFHEVISPREAAACNNGLIACYGLSLAVTPISAERIHVSEVSRKATAIIVNLLLTFPLQFWICYHRQQTGVHSARDCGNCHNFHYA